MALNQDTPVRSKNKQPIIVQNQQSQPPAAPRQAQQLPVKSSLRRKLADGLDNAWKDFKDALSGEVAKQASYRVACSLLLALTTAILALNYPEQVGPPVIGVLKFLSGKYSFLSLGIEIILAVCLAGLSALLGISRTVFDGVGLARRAVASSVIWAFAGLGGVMLFGAILSLGLGARAHGLLLLELSLLAYAELHIIAVPILKWALSRP